MIQGLQILSTKQKLQVTRQQQSSSSSSLPPERDDKNQHTQHLLYDILYINACKSTQQYNNTIS